MEDTLRSVIEALGSGLVTNILLMGIAYNLTGLVQKIHRYYIRDFHGIHIDD